MVFKVLAWCFVQTDNLYSLRLKVPCVLPFPLDLKRHPVKRVTKKQNSMTLKENQGNSINQKWRNEDLTWAVHCYYIVKKANRRLYALRQLKKCKVPSADIVDIYCALIRSILEYASAVFAGFSKYLACYLENVQKRVLSIIWPGISYETALDKAVLSFHSDRRTVSCIKFIGKVRWGNPLYPLIHSRVVPISPNVCLRSGSSSRPMAARTERFSNFVSVKYQSCKSM